MWSEASAVWAPLHEHLRQLHVLLPQWLHANAWRLLCKCVPKYCLLQSFRCFQWFSGPNWTEISALKKEFEMLMFHSSRFLGCKSETVWLLVLLNRLENLLSGSLSVRLWGGSGRNPLPLSLHRFTAQLRRKNLRWWVRNNSININRKKWGRNENNYPIHQIFLHFSDIYLEFNTE